jgi:hypothetical protein
LQIAAKLASTQRTTTLLRQTLQQWRRAATRLVARRQRYLASLAGIGRQPLLDARALNNRLLPPSMSSARALSALDDGSLSLPSNAVARLVAAVDQRARWRATPLDLASIVVHGVVAQRVVDMHDDDDDDDEAEEEDRVDDQLLFDCIISSPPDKIKTYLDFAILILQHSPHSFSHNIAILDN